MINKWPYEAIGNIVMKTGWQPLGIGYDLQYDVW